MNIISLGTDILSCADVEAVTRGAAAANLSPDARPKLEAARETVLRWSRENRPVYGVTRGLGERAVKEVPEETREGFSMTLVRARASGGGDYFDSSTVRAALFARAAGLAQGGGGVRPLIIETQLEMLARGVHPLVPRIGSTGASDLLLCANMALPLMGEGRAEFLGEILPGGEAMRRAGVAPVQLEEKEGLALCSSNAFSIGLGALVVQELSELLLIADAILALSFEAFRGNPSPFMAQAVAARAAPGQRAAAARLNLLLAGSKLYEADAPRRLQDPVSFRCATHVHGAVQVCLDMARDNIEIELNAAADNPLILPQEDLIISTGNFHMPMTAIAFDALRLALVELSTLSSERLTRMMQPEVSGLEGRLSRQGGVSRSGLGPLSVVAKALRQEAKHLSAPVSNDDVTPLGVEDQAPFTLDGIRRTQAQIDYVRQILACELIVAAQALEIRAPSGVARAPAALAAALREIVPTLEEDRSTTEDIERATAFLRVGAARVVRGAMAG